MFIIFMLWLATTISIGLAVDKLADEDVAAYTVLGWTVFYWLVWYSTTVNWLPVVF